jgi:hypothetical protein
VAGVARNKRGVEALGTKRGGVVRSSVGTRRGAEAPSEFGGHCRAMSELIGADVRPTSDGAPSDAASNHLRFLHLLLYPTVHQPTQHEHDGTACTVCCTFLLHVAPFSSYTDADLDVKLVRLVPLPQGSEPPTSFKALLWLPDALVVIILTTGTRRLDAHVTDLAASAAEPRALHALTRARGSPVVAENRSTTSKEMPPPIPSSGLINYLYRLTRRLRAAQHRSGFRPLWVGMLHPFDSLHRC